MKVTEEIPVQIDEPIPSGYQEVPWPSRGRFVFGPWCLLGAWPAVFGVIEETSDKESHP